MIRSLHGGSLAPSLTEDWPGINVERGEGAYLLTADGRRILDFTSGIGVTNTGHCHPKVVAAAIAQSQRLIHAAVGVAFADPLLQLVDALPAVTPEGLDAFFFGNSGAEAVEGAIKLARYVTGRPGIVAFLNGFHGRTYGAASVTSVKSKYRAHYEPFVGSVYFAPFADPFHGIVGITGDDVTGTAIAGLETVFDRLAPPGQIAAILVEPIQGEAGYIVPPQDFLRQLRRICDREGILMILDEVQSGFGRTGQMFGAQTFGVRPDIMAIAKGIASGFPLSATVARQDLMAEWGASSHGTTFGGNPVACAAALATLDVFESEGLLDNCRRQGERLIDGLRRLANDIPWVVDVRGRGLMIGMEFTDGTIAQDFLDRCLAQDLLLYVAGLHGEVARFIPPLTITSDQVDDALAVVERALTPIPVRVLN